MNAEIFSTTMLSDASLSAQLPQLAECLHGAERIIAIHLGRPSDEEQQRPAAVGWLSDDSLRTTVRTVTASWAAEPRYRSSYQRTTVSAQD